MFRGREMSHPERGRALLERLADDVTELGVIESAPIQDGRNMVMLLAPVRELPPTKPGANEAPAGRDRPRRSPRPRAGARKASQAEGGQARREPAAARSPREPTAAARSRARAGRPRTRTGTDEHLMPKMKTHSGAKKRFKLTGSGKLHAPPRHALAHPGEEDAEAEARLPSATSPSRTLTRSSSRACSAALRKERS